MKQRSIDILAVIVLTIVAVTLVFTVTPANMPVRILALPLVLVLPGYALTSAFVAKRAFGITERLVFSLGLSLVLVILGGFVLNLIPSGLHSGSWAILLGCITLGASVVTLVRRRGQGKSTSSMLEFNNLGFTFRQGLLLSLATVIVGGAIAVSIIGAERQPYAGFTQLWILPASGANAKNSVLLGVKNMENTNMNYLLDVNVDGKLVKMWRSIDLQSNGNWQVTLVIPQAKHGSSTLVEAMLYRADAPTKVYRHVELWLST
jgi:uncharacterized membrane protein